MHKSAAAFLTLLIPCFPALAAMPSNPPELKPIASHDTPAWRAAKNFQHGVNLGNWLEAPPGEDWGVSIAQEDFQRIKAEGFDHVRIPMGWHHYVGPAPDFIISPQFFARADWAVTNALDNGLAVMLNIHHFHELDADPVGTTPEFLAIWRQIAGHYAAFPPKLAFELDNEPHDKATTALMNPIYAQAIRKIRASNPSRTIFAEPGHWGSIDELKNLVLPPDDNIIVSIHCYEPFYFTHQGATWVGPDVKQTGVIFPGPPKVPLVPDPNLHLKPHVLKWFQGYNSLPAETNPSGPAAFRDKLRFCREWSEYYGRPVHLGEFGANEKVDVPSRVNFYRAMRQEAEADGLGWCIWDWSAGFHYWDVKRNRPVPGLHDALLGR